MKYNALPCFFFTCTIKWLQLCLFHIVHCSDQIKILLDQQERLYERQSELQALLEASKGLGPPVNGASTAAEDWSGSFEWDSRADDIRFNVFGISTYRANQREVTSIVAFFLFLLYTWSRLFC